MKSLVKGVLGAIGLAPAAYANRLSREVNGAAEKIRTLEDRLSKARADSDAWKRRSEDAVNTTADLKKSTSRAEAAVEKTRGEVQKAEARAEEWRARAESSATQVSELRARLEDSRRAATLAREQLMAMEVKLDLIEAAIQVLDARSRTEALSSADKLRT